MSPQAVHMKRDGIGRALANAARGLSVNRRKIHAAMEAAGLHFTWHEFNAQHAFMRDEGHRYDAELALKCYGLVLELFKRKLGEGDLPAAAAGAAGSRH